MNGGAMNAKERVSEIIVRIEKEYPEPRTALKYKTPFELLVATILSAQATDVLVNRITEPLFRKYKSARDYAEAPLENLQDDVRSVNFYRTKAKNIQAAAKMVIETYGSKMPQTMEDLIRLPGVARKTANIILFNAFGFNEGIAVDTHVNRLANRLGLTKQEDPVRVEADLMKVVPRNDWGVFSHLLILHGRKVCQAKKPKHQACVLFDICPSRDI
jgi:endonuclease-3